MIVVHSRDLAAENVTKLLASPDAILDDVEHAKPSERLVFAKILCSYAIEAATEPLIQKALIVLDSVIVAELKRVRF